MSYPCEGIEIETNNDDKTLVLIAKNNGCDIKIVLNTKHYNFAEAMRRLGWKRDTEAQPPAPTGRFVNVGTIDNPDAKVVGHPPEANPKFDGANGVVHFCGIAINEEWLEDMLIRLRNKIGEHRDKADNYSYAEFLSHGGRIRFTRDTRIVEFPDRLDDMTSVRGKVSLDTLRRVVAMCDKVPPRAKG